ncbi:MAG: OmpH family outer membrane protein [Nitrospiria bacterium]
MKRFIVYFAVLSLLPMWADRAHSETPKIGFVEAQKVLEGSQAGRRVQEKMEEYVQSRQKIIDLEEKELRQMEEELTRQSALLSPEAKQVKQEEFQRKLVGYQKKARELNKEVQEKKIESLKAFNRKMEAVIKTIAEKEGYTFVLDKGGEGGTVLYSSDSHDMTTQVIEALDASDAK